ncbi:rCG58531, isoform CRA_a [Rattus norvegicus]|uniref:RCG58531, isoform CRA_a n=1 Tax=Rattus norvegicus TaxID=10116 RepID=A6K6U8_RAT|nr:rCG58531, isoform CRA_a [Rattus norvegicus]
MYLVPLLANTLNVLQKMMRSLNQGSSAPGGAGKGEEPEKLPELAEDESQVLRGTGHCKWFNVRMGFGFISMISREGNPLDIPVDVFVHQLFPPSHHCRF